MSLATPKKIQTLQRKLCLKAKREPTLGLVNPTGVLQLRARLRKEPGPRAGCGQSARPVRRAGAGDGVMVGIEAPAL